MGVAAEAIPQPVLLGKPVGRWVEVGRGRRKDGNAAPRVSAGRVCPPGGWGRAGHASELPGCHPARSGLRLGVPVLRPRCAPRAARAAGPRGHPCRPRRAGRVLRPPTSAAATALGGEQLPGPVGPGPAVCGLVPPPHLRWPLTHAGLWPLWLQAERTKPSCDVAHSLLAAPSCGSGCHMVQSRSGLVPAAPRTAPPPRRLLPAPAGGSQALPALGCPPPLAWHSPE